MMWSTHSRRIDPINRSAKPFCQGEAGAVGLSHRRRTPVTCRQLLDPRTSDALSCRSDQLTNMLAAMPRLLDALALSAGYPDPRLPHPTAQRLPRIQCGDRRIAGKVALQDVDDDRINLDARHVTQAEEALRQDVPAAAHADHGTRFQV